jgi:flagellin
MALTISDTLSSLVNLNVNSTMNRMTNTMQRLSSGLRINSAKDDPAGMTLASHLNTSALMQRQAAQNANTGINLLQTADSSMSQISSKLTEMKALAEQAASGTYTDAQRVIMQSEFSSMGAEIDRLASSAEFNGTKLLNGNLSATSNWSSAGGWSEPTGKTMIQVGEGNSRSEDQIPITIKDARTTALFGGSTPTIATQSGAESALSSLDTAIDYSNNAQAWIGAQQNRLSSAMDTASIMAANLETASSSIMDADFASELTQYTADNVRLQSGIAMLAQANSAPEALLSLFNER